MATKSSISIKVVSHKKGAGAKVADKAMALAKAKLAQYDTKSKKKK